MRNIGLSLLSFGLTGAVVANAYYQKKQFYPSVVYITKSNSSMAVIYIQALIMVMLAGKLVKKIFFGTLRAAEFEHLMERSWYAITETCLAFTVFKDDFSPKFVALFTLLLFLKAFHWLTEDRVDFMERSPMISYLFHTRIIILLTTLGILDMYFVVGAYQTTIAKGASVMIVFGFEYAILLTVVINIVIKYLLHTIDLNRDIFWESKAVFFLYMELVMSFVKAIMYVAFVVIMMKVYTLPLFAFRPMYYAARSFRKALKDVINSRRAIHHLNNSFPDATTEEITNADNVCIICREEMQSGSKKLPCNHIFHTSCLRSWFQRHQTCPTCRTSILDNSSTSTRDNPAAAPQAPQDNNGMPQQGIPPFIPWGIYIPVPPAGPAPPPTAATGTVPPQSASGVPPSTSQPSASNTMPNGIPPGSNGMPPPPFMPSMMPPFMAYTIPPPVPPADFGNLTDEELREMENSTRAGVEARLRCLQNIQLLLDASSLMLQQYSYTAAQANHNIINTQPPPTQPTAGTSHQGYTSTPGAGPSPTAQTSTSTSTAQPSSTTAIIDQSTNENQSDTTTKSTESNTETDEQREVRLRRLQKFASAAISSNE